MEGNKIMQAMTTGKYLEKNGLDTQRYPPFPFHEWTKYLLNLLVRVNTPGDTRHVIYAAWALLSPIPNLDRKDQDQLM